MSDRHFKRVLMHLAAVLAAVAVWWVASDSAIALGGSVLAFLLVNATGHVAFGPMPSGEDVRRDVEQTLRRRE